MTPSVESAGFAMACQVVPINAVQFLRQYLGGTKGAGRRGLLGDVVVHRLACSPELLALVRPHLAGAPQPVRALYFDKTPDANWSVPWHQDLAIAVREKHPLPGYTGWSLKAGLHHVHPPSQILAEMLTVRLHLDDADESNGALQVLPGSHRRGRLTDDEIRELLVEGSPLLCRAHAGDALLMRPLLVHASRKSQANESHRRVLHLEYAGTRLPPPLDWAEAA